MSWMESRDFQYPWIRRPMMIRIDRQDFQYTGITRPPTFFHEGKMLKVGEVRQALEEYYAVTMLKVDVPGMLSVFREAEQRYSTMLDLYRGLKPRRFPVSRLKHVTVKANFLNILNEEGFRGAERTFPLNGRLTNLPVSCWGVDIPPVDIQNLKKQRFREFRKAARETLPRKTLPWPHLSGEHRANVRDMMANSPAFSQVSRYGNFHFSFPMRVLLKAYQNQHCQGVKPVLRVLGTESFTQEIVHWVLIHGPHCTDFDHLPTVDPQEPLSRDGNLMWEPESMTDQFTWQITHCTSVPLQKKPQLPGNGTVLQAYDAWVWNNAVFAFHLPGNNALWINRSQLLDSVEACESPPDPRILRHPKAQYVSKEEAQAIINMEALRK